MDNLFYKLVDWFYIAGVEVLITIIAIAVIVLQKFKQQRSQFSYYLDSPVATLLLDSQSGKITLANRNAMQLLSIRKIGKNYFYPSDGNQNAILSSLNKIEGRSFKELHFDWSNSDFQGVKVDFSGRKTRFMGRYSWVLTANVLQSSEHEGEQVKNSLRIARTSLDSLSELIYIKDNKGNIIDTNRSFDKFWQGRVDEMDVEIDGALKGRKTQRRWTTDPQGRGCLLETSESILLTDDGEVLGSLGLSHDVTDWFKMQQDLRDEMEKRKGTEIALAQRDTILQSLLEASPDAIALFNENRVYEACNQAFADTVGIEDYRTMLGKRIEDVLPEEFYTQFKASDEQVIKEGGSQRYREEKVDKNGSPQWFDVVKSQYKDPSSGASGVLLMARDVTESRLVAMQLEEMNTELQRLSFLDGLTQIANRRRFDEQLDIVWNLHQRQEQPLTIMLCDIDYFKNYNDNYGHQKGDEILKVVANTFQNILNRASDCVARYGGEEFAFVIPNTGHHGAKTIAEHIHEAIHQNDIEHQYSLISDRITLSIGVVSITPTPQDTPEKLIEFADQALYLAKNEGRNQTRYHKAES